MNKVSRILSSVFACTLFAMTVNAQTRDFTLNDLLSGGDSFWKLRAENKQITWWGTIPVETTPEEIRDMNTGKSLTVEHINEMLGETVLRNGHSVSFPYATEPIADFSVAGRHLQLNFRSGEKVMDVTLPKGSANADFHKESRNTAFTIQGNLYILGADGTQTQISKDGSVDGSDNIVYGQSVHRDEFGIHKGTFWNREGDILAYYRMDQSMVPSYPQVDIKSRIASTYTDHYPMAGETSHNVKVGIYNTRTKQNVWLELEGAADDYHTNLSWSPDSKILYIFEVNRDQNDMRLVAYDAESGKAIRTILQERNDKYVEPMNPLTFLPWDDNKAVMQSQRDGYNHLYILDVRSGSATQVTKGKWVVQKFVGFNTMSKSLIYLSNEAEPRTSCIYSVRANGGKRTLIGSNEGVHYQAVLSSNGQQILDGYTSPTVPRSINILSTTTGKGKNILTATDKWQEAGFRIPEITSGSIKAADGVTDLYYRMVKPADFDPAKKYPTVVYVYGGPHAHNVEASWHWGMRGWEAYMAQKGYVLFILDNRGSEWRGLEFEQATFRQLGVIEREDQYEGIKFLKSLPYVDADRIGVHGWSFGGYMTTNLMLTYPDDFKVGVAGGPVIDWSYYEVMYGERYMDTPQQNPEGYEKCNLRNRAANLKGRLQLIIGYNDPTCVPQHSLSFIRACEDAGTQPDFFLYPGGEHNMYGKDMIHLHERITRYFEDYLK